MENIIKKLNDAGVNIDDLEVVDITSSTIEICLEVNTPETDKLKEEIAERELKEGNIFGLTTKEEIMNDIVFYNTIVFPDKLSFLKVLQYIENRKDVKKTPRNVEWLNTYVKDVRNTLLKLVDKLDAKDNLEMIAEAYWRYVNEDESNPEMTEMMLPLEKETEDFWLSKNYISGYCRYNNANMEYLFDKGTGLDVLPDEECYSQRKIVLDTNAKEQFWFMYIDSAGYTVLSDWVWCLPEDEREEAYTYLTSTTENHIDTEIGKKVATAFLKELLYGNTIFKD